MADTAVIFNIVARDQASSTFKKVGTAASALFSGLAVGQGISMMKDAIGAASDLSETQSKVNVLFGQGASAIDQWASGADKALGQSKQQALDAAATFALYGKTAGLAGQDLVGFSTKMTGLASDMASFSNTSPQEAIDAIGAAMRGEFDPIEKYGVLLNQTTIQNQAMALGMIKTTSQALTPQQRVLAVQAAILSQTGSAQGDFARTSGGLANQQRILSAEFTNVKTQLGSQLLPVMLKFTHGLMAVIGFVQANQGWLKPIAIGIGVMAAAIWLATTAQTAWNIAMSLNPIGLIIIGVAALIAVIVYLAVKTQFFQTIWGATWDFLKAIGSWFAGPFAGFFVAGYDKVVGFAEGAIGWFKKIPGELKSAGAKVVDVITWPYRQAFNAIAGFWNGTVGKLSFSVPSWVPGIGGKGFSMPQLPKLAKGGMITRSGLAVVGDQGAEVVSLPTGSTVYPHGTGPAGPQRTATLTVAGNADTALAAFLHSLIRSGILQVQMT